MMSLRTWMILLGFASLTNGLSKLDIKRARMWMVPHDSPVKVKTITNSHGDDNKKEKGSPTNEQNLRGSYLKTPWNKREKAKDLFASRVDVTRWLNQFMRQTVKGDVLVRCESFSPPELDAVISNLVRVSHPGFQEIYQKGGDKRVRPKKKISQDVQDSITEASKEKDPPLWVHAVKDVLRDGKCYEAVMLWYHHLDSTSRNNIQVASKGHFKLPLLPENSDAIDFLVDILKAKRSHDRKLQDEDRFNPSRYNHYAHSDLFTNLTYEEGLVIQEKLWSTLNESQVTELIASFNQQSPCQLAHGRLAPEWDEDTAIRAGFDPAQAAFYAQQIQNDTFNQEGVDPEGDIPDTTTPGSGYWECDQAAECLEGGDQQYMLQAVVRVIKVPGSGRIYIPQESDLGIVNSDQPFGEDLLFHTRTFEGMPESPSAWGPDKAGGDGTAGLLGPAFVASPGQTVKVFVKNNFGDAQNYLGPGLDSAQDYWNRIQVIRNPQRNASFGFAPWIPFTGPEWQQDEYPFNESNPVPAEDMTMGAGEQNLPGYETNGFDIFNIHMHGWEVAPHLFYPPGTSDPEAPWVEIKPEADSGQQCMCYTFQVAETQSRGDFIYHTHRHGTTSILTWGGMFGMTLTGEQSVEEARNRTADDPPSLTSDLLSIAEKEGLEFNDSDVNFVVIYDSAWAYADFQNETTGETTVIVSDFLSGATGHSGPTQSKLEPFFVNNEYQPTIHARTGALTEFRVVCVSADKMCAFQILEGDGLSNDTSTIVPFDRVASDGITYQYPVYRKANANPLLPDVTASEAYLSMGGGMREVVVVQFERPGTYHVWQRCNAFDDGVEQMLMTIEVTGKEVQRKDIKQYELASYRPLISEEREINQYRGLTFNTDYNQEVYPFPYYLVGGINGGNESEPYDIDHFDIGAIGGTCGIWVIRSLDTNIHPFHIHVNPFQILNSSSHFVEDNPDLIFVVNDYTAPWDSQKGTALNNIWRDTAMVPPYGYLVIKQCYDAGVAPSLGEDIKTFGGKFVFHCHFLVHEDTGLMRNVILGSNGTNDETSASLVPVMSGALMILSTMLTIVSLLG